MTRIAMRLSAVLAIGVLLTGCTYSRKVSDYAERVELRKNLIEEITGAWLTPDDEILACAKGWPAAIARDKPAVELEFLFPATLSKDMVNQPSETAVGKPEIVVYPLPAEGIDRGCGAPESGRRLPIHDVDAEAFRARSEQPLSDGAFTVDLDGSAAGAALYVPRGAGTVWVNRFFYVHGNPESGEPRLVAIELPDEEVQPNKAAGMAVPAAAAFDGFLFTGRVVQITVLVLLTVAVAM